jgi:hypothetical protein
MLGCSLSPRRRGISAGLGVDAIARLVDHVVITVRRVNQAGCHGCFASTECAVGLLGTRPGDPALLVAAPAVQNRHPRLAVVKFVDGNQIVEGLGFHEPELTPDSRQGPRPADEAPAAERAVQRFIAPPGTGAVQFVISAGLGHVFRNLTRILGNPDIDDPSAGGM